MSESHEIEKKIHEQVQHILDKISEMHISHKKRKVPTWLIPVTFILGFVIGFLINPILLPYITGYRVFLFLLASGFVAVAYTQLRKRS